MLAGLEGVSAAGPLAEVLSSWLTHEGATARLRCTLGKEGKDTARVLAMLETPRCIVGWLILLRPGSAILTDQPA